MRRLFLRKLIDISNKPLSRRRVMGTRTSVFEVLEPRQMLATIGTGFTAGSGPGFIPPDTMGAVGPNEIVELINGRLRFTTSPVLNYRRHHWTSFGAARVLRRSIRIRPPRVLYDPSSERWFAVSVDNGGAANRYLVAVSDDSDPTAGWTGFAIDSDEDDTHWADFPMLGLNHDVVVVSANMFSISGQDATVSLLVLPKADLLASSPSVANHTIFDNIIDTGYTPQPIVDIDSGSLPLNVLSANDKPSGWLRATSIEGTSDKPDPQYHGRRYFGHARSHHRTSINLGPKRISCGLHEIQWECDSATH